LARDAFEYLRLRACRLHNLPADVIAASVVINLLGLALPLAILQVYDRIIPNAATSTLLFLILCMFVVEAFERGGELRSATVGRAAAEAKVGDFLVEALNGIVAVKAFATEQQVNVLRGNTTVLFVTARPSHMRVADRVLVMSAGVVVASGKPGAIVPAIAEGIQTNAT
jgi:ABC-type protease/lipase transport system fused ATPase/permease subunit